MHTEMMTSIPVRRCLQIIPTFRISPQPQVHYCVYHKGRY